VGTSGAIALSTSITTIDLPVAVDVSDWATGSVEFSVCLPHHGTIDIYAVALEIPFIPDQTKLEATRVVSVATRPTSRDSTTASYGAYTRADFMPASQEMSSNFYANVDGVADADGSYTGTAGALIERPCDIAAHLLRVYGAQDSGAVGDTFSASRALLKERLHGSDMVLGLSLTSEDVGTALAIIAKSSASWVFLSPATDEWRFVPWCHGAEVESDRVLGVSGLVSLPAVSGSTSSIAPATSVVYGYDAKDDSYKHEVYLSPVRSSAGYEYNNLPDQSVEIVAGVNDKLDIWSGATVSK
jgi:hypothetical protein